MSRITLGSYLSDQTKEALPDSLSSLIEEIACACKNISQHLSMGSINNLLGSTSKRNIQGEVQKEMDLIANDILINKTVSNGHLAAIASEEIADVYQIPFAYPRGEYLLIFDPLDGSSNININTSIGTIFSVLRSPKRVTDRTENITPEAFLQIGRRQVIAGYVLYGPQTILILTFGDGVKGFALDPIANEFVLVYDNILIPENTKEFSINMSNQRHWKTPVRKYINDVIAGDQGPLKKDYNMRWIAAMVAEVHRILIRGGVFIYPSDSRESSKEGKLRLMYEASPMAFIIEQAGGLSTNGYKNILEIEPRNIHQKTAVFLGSKKEIERINKYHLEDLHHNNLIKF